MSDLGSRHNPWPIAVGDLDRWIAHRDDDESSQDDFLAELRREGPRTPAMVVGQCWHRALEVLMLYGEGHEQDTLAAPWREWECRFHVESWLSVTIPSAPLVERDITRALDTGCGWCVLRGVVDVIGAHRVADWKTTRSIRCDRYHDSMQWRAYLWMAGESHRRFDYEVAQVAYPETATLDDMRIGSRFPVRVRDWARLTLWRHDGMANEIAEVAAELVEWMTATGFVPPAKRPMVTL